MKSIIALFQPQAWIDENAVDIDGKKEVDVTHRVLALSLTQIHGLKDYRNSTDDLVNATAVTIEHDGPFTVRAVDSICEFFGVDTLSDITCEMLDAARLEATPLGPGMVKFVRLQEQGKLKKGDLVETQINGICEVAWIKTASTFVVKNAAGAYVELNVDFPAGARVVG